MDTLSLALILGPLAAAIVMALGPGWQTFQEPEPVRVAPTPHRRRAVRVGEPPASPDGQ